MLYRKIAELYEDVSGTTKRLEKTAILSRFLRRLSEKDKDVLYLLLGDIYPEYDGRKIGISSQLAVKSISRAAGVSVDGVTAEWKSVGDLGRVAEKLIGKKRQRRLHQGVLRADRVLADLRKLPELVGKGTVEKKLGLIVEILSLATPIEALYVVRTLIGDLRIGIKESTIRDAMALAFFEDNKKVAAEKIQGAIDKSNDIAVVFEKVKGGSLKRLDGISMEIGKPIKAMLAQKAESIADGFEKLGVPCAVEYKYDGFRLIIHKDGEDVVLFTRRLENVTRQFPEVADYVRKYVKGRSFILDSEAVGFHKDSKEYTPFQDISKRIKRKYDIEKLREDLPVEINVFDIIYYDGKTLLDEAFEKRTALIKDIISESKYKIKHSKQIITGDEGRAKRFYAGALRDNQEGVMMKNLEAVYQPGNRVGHMLKVKPEERDFDLVITGAEYGTGKRSGWMSSFIVACKDGKKFLEVGKVGTGIKEKSEEGISFKELTDKLTPLIKKEKGRAVELKPAVVVAVTYQEIQKSPNYESGFALRFPRVTNLRDDKPLNDITTIKEIEEGFGGQKRNWKYG